MRAKRAAKCATFELKQRLNVRFEALIGSCLGRATRPDNKRDHAQCTLSAFRAPYGPY